VSVVSLVLIGAGVLLAGLFLYWQLIIAEGVYLGSGVVTLLYDIAATRYDGIKQFDELNEAAFLGYPLTHALSATPAPHVLDVGTGTARLPLALFEQPTFNGRVVALDASRRMLRIAAKKVAPFAHRIDLLWMDAARLPFPDGTFDAVTCLEVLEFTPNPAGQLAELVRVLRPGGVLLTTRRRGFDARVMPGKTHPREAFIALLTSLGLRGVQVNPWQMDYDLVWALRPGGPRPAMGGVRPLVEVLRCPACQRVALQPEGTAFACGHCSARFQRRAGVVELRRRSG